MKRNILLSLCIMLLVTGYAQVPLTINVPTVGTLTTLLSASNKTSVTNLTVTGNIDARDIKCIRDEVTNLSVLDLSGTSVNAFTGTGGTADPLSSVSYPANEMPQYSFCYYNNSTGKTTLTTVILPNSLLTIGLRAFNNCSGLTGITIPGQVTSVGSNAFVNCTGLTSLIIGNSVTSVGNSAFLGCMSLTSLNIPNSVISIGTQAFYNCSGLTSLVLGASVSSIGDNSFLNCSALQSITVPRSVPPVIYTNTFTGVNYTTCKIYVPTGSTSAYQQDANWKLFSQFTENATANSYSITFQSGANGSIQLNNVVEANGSSIMVNSGDIKAFTISPMLGYEILSLNYNGLDVKSQLMNNVFTTSAVTANSNLSVTFQKSVYNLSIASAATGTINQVCSYGDSPSYSFSPASGWKVYTVFYNGTEVTGALVNGIYKVPAITANSSLVVSFVNTVTNAPEVINNRVKLTTNASGIIVEGTNPGETVELFALNGSKLQSLSSTGEKINIPVEKGKIYLVKTSSKTFKVIL